MADDGEVTFNNREIQRILNSPAVAAEVKRVCDLIVARARVVAPVDTGTYIRSFKVEMKRRKQLRTVGYVVNTDSKAMLIEAKYGVLAKSRRAR